MTEKEFEQLEIGDRVWSVTNIWPEGKGLYEMKVVGKRIDLRYIETSWLDGSHKTNFFRLDCQTSKAKALEAVIARCEAHIKDKENDIACEKKEVDRYKAELAKAKEEEDKEQKVWIVDFEEGSVICSAKGRWEHSCECYEYEAGSDRYKPCSTEQEAYEALADYYKGKFEEALKKACDVRYFVINGRVITLHDCYCDGNFYGYDYDGRPHCSVHKERDIFNTRREAELELERRKK